MAQVQGNWEQVCELVASALELAPEARAAFLDEFAGDTSVREEAASLIAAAEQGTGANLFDSGLQVMVPSLAESDGDRWWSGKSLGAYRVIGELGEGGMGLVLLGQRDDALYERKVAIKVIRSALAGEEFTRRFRRETRILAKLRHPAITSLLDAGTTEDGLPYLVMEYVDGLPLQIYAEREGLGLGRVLDLVMTLCDALAHAHAQGVVHRDVKPSNVLVTSAGELKLLDFGIARLVAPVDGAGEQTLTDFRAVTPAYASPEQIAGREITFATDIYSVGVLLYVLVTGAPPFQLHGLSPAEIERVVEGSQAALPSKRAVGRFTRKEIAALDPVIGRAMHPQPGRRYGSILELKADLLQVQRQEKPGVSAGRYRRARWWRQWRGAVRAGAIATAGIAAVTGLVFHERHHGAKASVPVQPRRLSVAVVPLAGTGPEAVRAESEALFSTALASGDQIRVVPSSDVAQALRDLRLASLREYSAAQVQQLAKLLGVDYLVEEQVDGQVGSDAVRLQTGIRRAQSGDLIATQHAEAPLSGLEQATQALAVSTAGVLPLKQALAPPPSLLPHAPGAARAYAEGLEKLAALDPASARPAFEEAARIEPKSPLVHAGLARAWEMLGYHPHAVAEAEQAIALDAGLPMRTRLVVEAQANEIRHQWPQAINGYRTLHDFDPDQVDYVLGLARVQLAANQGEAALATLRAAQDMPSLLGADPRITLLAASVEDSLHHDEDALRLANEAFAAGKERGASQLMAQAQSTRASALETLGRANEGMEAAKQAEALFVSAGDQHGQGVTLVATGNFLEDHGRYAEAKDCYLRAKRIFAETGDEAREAAAENNLGIVADDFGDYAEAATHYRNALVVFQRIGNLPRVAAEFNNIGITELKRNDADAARRDYTAALKLLIASHDTQQTAREYNNLGFLFIRAGDLDGAEADFRQARKLYGDAGQLSGTILATEGLAHVALQRGKLGEAHAAYQEAIRVARQVPDVRHQSIALRADAYVLHQAGDESSALRELNQAEQMRESHGETLATAESKVSQMLFALDDGQTIAPESRFGDLLQVFAAKQDDSDAAEVHVMWARSLLDEGRLNEASQHLEEANAARAKAHDPDVDWDCLNVAALLAMKRNQTSTALGFAQRAIAQAQAHKNVPNEMEARLVLARIRMTSPDARSRALIEQFGADAQARGFGREAAQVKALLGQK